MQIWDPTYECMPREEMLRMQTSLQVAVTLVNTSARPVPYGRSDFRLRPANGAPATHARASRRTGHASTMRCSSSGSSRC